MLSPGLHKAEVGRFLEFLFGDIAVRPAPLRPREAAAVVRYLLLLACAGVPREVNAQGGDAIELYWRTGRPPDSEARQAAERLANGLWGDLRRYGQINLPKNIRHRAQEFLRRCSKTYLAANPYLPLAQKLLEEFLIPTDARHPFAPPNLRSRSMTACGVGNSYLGDDVSERIYAGYHALKGAQVRGARRLVAQALKNERIQMRARPLGKTEWSDVEVYNRAKNYKTLLEEALMPSLKKPIEANELKRAVQQRTDQLVQKWVSAFRYHTRARVQN
jgi:hypothetical protein